MPAHPNRDFSIADFAEAADGSLWLNTSWGLVRRLPDRRIVFYEGETFTTTGNLAMMMAADDYRRPLRQNLRGNGARR